MNDYTITWDSFKNNIFNGFSIQQQQEEFVDMTLAAEGHLVKVHKNLMALASPYIKDMLQSAPCQHPILFINNVDHDVLSYILEYIYTGEVQLPSRKINNFLSAAKALHIRGIDQVIPPEDIKNHNQKPNNHIERPEHTTVHKPCNFETSVAGLETEVKCESNNDQALKKSQTYNFSDPLSIKRKCILTATTKTHLHNMIMHNNQQDITTITDNKISNCQNLKPLINGANRENGMNASNSDMHYQNQVHLKNTIDTIKDLTKKITPIEKSSEIIAHMKTIEFDKNIDNQMLSIQNMESEANMDIEENIHCEHDYSVQMQLSDFIKLPAIRCAENLNSNMQQQIGSDVFTTLHEDINDVPGDNENIQLPPSYRNENTYDRNVTNIDTNNSIHAKNNFNVQLSDCIVPESDSWDNSSMEHENNNQNEIIIRVMDNNVRNDIDTGLQPNHENRELGVQNIPHCDEIVATDINIFANHDYNVALNFPDTANKQCGGLISANRLNKTEESYSSNNIQIDVMQPSSMINEKESQNPLYTISKRQSLLMILNRYLYNLHHTSHQGKKRRWRCVNYRKSGCKAFIDTDEEQFAGRKNTHNHEFHDLEIIEKGRSTMVFTTIAATETHIKNSQISHEISEHSSVLNTW